MNYYIQSENGGEGPFTFAELKTQRLTKDTLVWYAGLEEWTKAGEILELIDIASGTPVPARKTIVQLLLEMNCKVDLSME